MNYVYYIVLAILILVEIRIIIILCKIKELKQFSLFSAVEVTTTPSQASMSFQLCFRRPIVQTALRTLQAH